MKTQISLVALIVVGNAFAGALDNWHWRNPLPTAALLQDVTFGGDRFVAVGGGGSIVTSTDGENWTARSSGSQAALDGVAYGNGMFLAFGDEGTNGVVLTSPDGLTWTLSTAQTGARLRDVTYAQGMFVGVGDALSLGNGAIIQLIETSPDGRNWTTQASLPGLTRPPILPVLNSIAYGNGTFVAVGERGYIVTSTDRSNWTEIGSGPDRTLFGVAFGEGLFVAVGYEPGFNVVLTSPDGLNWATALSARQPPLDLLLAVNYGNGLFVACGEGSAVLASPDGLAWTEYDLDLGERRILRGIAYGNGHHAAVGYWFPIYGVGTAAIVSSSTGVTWKDRASVVVTEDNRGLAFGKGTYVAASFIGVVASTNGSNWTQTAEMGASGLFFGAAYGNGVFLAVGGYGTNARQGLLLVSTNGMEWTNRSPPGATRLFSAAYGGGRFVVVGWTNALVSTNGWDWRASTSATATNLLAVTFGEDRFVGVGSRGTIQTSTDGLDWLTRSSGTNVSLRGVGFGNGKYVAVGNEAIVTSTNAVDWSISQTGVWTLEGVAFGGGTFVAVGEGRDPSLTRRRGVILTSEDGLVWTERPFSSGINLWSVVYDGRTFLIGGDGGTILQSDPLVAGLAPLLGIRRASGIELILSGTAGTTYRIEYRAELGPGIPWSSLTTLVITNGSGTFTDPQTPAATKRFYRSVLLP